MNAKVFLLAALAATVSMTSCKKNGTPEVNDVKVEFTSSITAATQTKVATDNDGVGTWNLDDPIGIYMVERGTTTIAESAENVPYKAASATTSTSFAPSGATTIYYPVNMPLKVDFIAYHPYQSSVSDWAYSIDVSSQNSQTGIDLMYAIANNSGTGYDKGSANVNLTFNHQLVKLIMNVTTGTGVTGNVTSVSITGMNTSAEFDLKTAGLTNLGNVKEIAPYTATTGTKYEAILLPAATLGATNTVTFTTSENETFTWPMSGDISSLTAGRIYVYDITLTRNEVNVTGNIANWDKDTTGGTGIAE